MDWNDVNSVFFFLGNSIQDDSLAFRIVLFYFVEILYNSTNQF